MATEFEVHRSFHLPDRSLFGVAGVFREGMVEVGMVAEVQDGEREFEARVHGVEFEGDEPSLLFSYSRPEKLERWQALDWPGTVLTLTWRGR